MADWRGEYDLLLLMLKISVALVATVFTAIAVVEPRLYCLVTMTASGYFLHQIDAPKTFNQKLIISMGFLSPMRLVSQLP